MSASSKSISTLPSDILGSVSMARETEKCWLTEMKGRLVKQGPDFQSGQVCTVFMVPHDLKAGKPEAYVPQEVSVGPYHAWRSDLHDMEHLKAAAALQFLQSSDAHAKTDFSEWDKRFERKVVAKIREMEATIRGSYNKYIRCEGESLAWLMAFDGVFLLDNLRCYLSTRASSGETHRNASGEAGISRMTPTASRDAILRDLIKLENQIPLVVLGKLLEIKAGSAQEAHKTLVDLLQSACKHFSPFFSSQNVYRMNLDKATTINQSDSDHLLGVLYHTLLPAANQSENDGSHVSSESRTIQSVTIAASSSEKSATESSANTITHSLRHGLLQKSAWIVTWIRELLRDLLGLAPSARKCGSRRREETVPGNSVIEIPPTRAELAIPSVSQLKSAGVKFAAASANLEGDVLSCIKFDAKRQTLTLPKLRIDNNTDAVIRNLVAYELCIGGSGGRMLFTRYIDFLNGIIDNANDVQILKSGGVIVHQLQNDVKVANIWNSIGACVRLSAVTFLDEVVKDVNDFYNTKWNVKFRRCMEEYVFRTWRCLSLVAALILLSMNIVQAFCTVYDCRRWFDISAISSSSFASD